MLRLRLFLLCLLLGNISYSQEICNNAIDDDGDGLIDLNDSLDCACDPFNAVPSLIANPSFESFNCCPTGLAQLSCANNWQPGGIGTIDYYNYCDFGAPINSTNAPSLPLPGNGNGYAGFATFTSGSENLGTCLTGPMIAGNSYTISFFMTRGFGPVNYNFSIFGATACSSLPSLSVCPSNSVNWQVLASQTVTFTTIGVWQQVVMTFTPLVNINALVFGSTCGTGVAPGYYYMDEMILNASSLFGGITEQGEYCEGDLELTVTSGIIATNYQWYRNGVALVGETGDSVIVSNYLTGNYTVTFDQFGNCNRFEYLVNPPIYPVANVISVADSICAGESAILRGDSTATIAPYNSWFFDFQDGSAIDFSYNVAKQYQNPGNYNIKFLVESPVGCKDSIDIPITVFPLPVAQAELTIAGSNFSVNEGDTLTFCGNGALLFNNLSTSLPPNIITNYAWNFGDQNTSIIESPSHQFANAGIYNVLQVAETDKGCLDSLSFFVEILAVPLPNFTFSANNCQGEVINFTNTSTTLPVGNIDGYSWQFGDGSQNTNLNPQYQYLAQGNYNVQLVVENTNGCKDSLTQSITIHPNPVANFQITNFCQNETINFADLSSVANATINNWNWTFGDGTNSNTQNTSHNYTAPNNYTVSLIVESDQGCRDTLDSLVAIYPAPEPAFSAADFCENEPVAIINNSSISTGTLTYHWTFENNGNSALPSPLSVTYATSGVYNIDLLLTSDQGCVDSLSQMLTVHPTPVAQIIQDPILGCSPFTVQLNSLQSDIISNCIWNLGDGTVRENCGIIRHEYGPGLFNVELTVITDFGCENSILMINFIDISASPIADFTYAPSVVTVEENNVIFENQSDNATTFLWDFGSGLGTSEDENPSFTFPTVAGTYNVTLKVVGDNGRCTDEVSQTFQLFDNVIFYVPNAFTPNGSGSNNFFAPVITAGIDIYSYQLRIFNRWGELVFISNNPAIGWDGNYTGKPAQEGVYIWQIDYRTILIDERMNENGTVTLIR